MFCKIFQMKIFNFFAFAPIMCSLAAQQTMMRGRHLVQNDTLVEIDIDEIDRTHLKIFAGGQTLFCNPKTPPLSHSWSYECSTEAYPSLK